MPYVVFVATDMMGQKINLELEFPFAPTLAELTQMSERAFEAEVAARGCPTPQGGHPPFQVAKFHVVDEVTDDWVEVLAAQQLRNYCQVYVFQPHSTRYTESQGHIPPATKPRFTAAVGGLPPPQPGSAQRYSEAQPSAVTPGGWQPPAPAASVPQVPALMPQKHFPDAASHDDKVRSTFEEVDENRNRVLELDEVCKGFRLANLSFTRETEEDLFRKADADADGVVSFAEWQRFCELYPTMLDCLYFRFQAQYDNLAKEAQIEAAKAARAALEDQERAAQAAFDKAVQDADEAARRVADADAGANDAQRRLRAAEDQARGAGGEVDRARQALADRQRDLAAEQERERQAHLRAADSQREMEQAQRREAAAQQAVADAEMAEARARQALEDAQREKQRQQGLADQAAGDAAAARQRHDQIIGQIPQTVEAAARAVQAADADAAAADRRARDLALAAGEAARAAEDAARGRDDASRVMQALRERQEPARQALTDHQRALEQHDRQVSDLEVAAQEDARKQEAMWAELRPVVEQEVRLRQQRESLEEREGALRAAHTNFFQQHKAGENPSAPPSAAAGAYGASPAYGAPRY